MPVKQILRAMRWLPHVFAVVTALVFALAIWPPRTNLQEWKPSVRMPIGIEAVHPGTLTWKQPILPAQYTQASCGACHHDDLPETPRLNHGRQLIVRLNCVGCHRLQNVDRPAMLGPDLTNVGRKVSRQWIYKWLRDPRTVTDADGNVVVDGVATNPRMPKFQLTDLELRALSAYLSVQGAKPGTHNVGRVTAAGSAGSGDAADQGQTRFNQMFCVTCHSLAVDRGGETTLIGGDIGPELTKVGSKVSREWLVEWLRNPEGYLQHTRMPQYEWSDKDLREVTEFILTKLTDPDLLRGVPQLGPPTPDEVKLGQRLFVEKGCAECHVILGVVPRSDFGPDLSTLGMAGGPFIVDVASASKLPVPLHFVKSDARRLEIGVSRIPRSMIAYIQTKITDPASVTPETHMPRFDLSKADLDDLTTAVLSMSGHPISPEGSDQLIIEHHHAQFRPDGEMGQLYQRYKCYQCHSFKGFGGTLAPDLSYEGSRSRRQWLVDFLMDPQTLRPTLTVRMPHFNMSQKDATTIADYIVSDLRNPNIHSTPPADSELTPQMAAHGKQLFEEKYKCQSCHTIGSSGGYVGPSLNNAGNWLTPAWVEAWLSDPQALVPGAIEPRQPILAEERRDLTAYLMTLKQAPANKNSQAATGGQQ